MNSPLFEAAHRATKWRARQREEFLGCCAAGSVCTLNRDSTKSCDFRQNESTSDKLTREINSSLSREPQRARYSSGIRLGMYLCSGRAQTATFAKLTHTIFRISI